jgi:2-polyprenyl-3-methyl-5-hydroxy-6-metoxy-1,4-benzoquinol methylase
MKPNSSERINTTKKPRSPLGGSDCLLLKTLCASEIKSKIEEYYGTQIPAKIKIQGYQIWRDRESNLEFSEPMVAGSADYYNWLGAQPDYYPPYRWEYDAVISELKTVPRHRINVLDIGCGDGTFLQHLVAGVENVQATGVDTSPEAINNAAVRGLSCKVGDHRTLLLDGGLPKKSFDVVCAFHCLEHVENPVAFVAGMVEAMADDGKVYISTPLSPMPHEHAWFDIQNHPPHHLTRWSKAAYRHLAEQLNLKARFIACKHPLGPIAAWRSMVKLKILGPTNKKVGVRGRVTKILNSPRYTNLLLSCLFRWVKAKGQGFQNDVLVEFVRKA